MANLSVFQSTPSCGAHNQTAFNCLSSCFLLNSISWQKTNLLLALYHGQETNWSGSLAVTVPVQGSMSILVSYQVDSLALKAAYSSHSAAWLTLGVKEQRKCDSFGIHDASKQGEGGGWGKYLFPAFSGSSSAAPFSQCWRLDSFICYNWKHR